MGLISASFLDFRAPRFKTSNIIKPLIFGKLGLPRTAQRGDVSYMDSRVLMEFLNDGSRRFLSCRFNNFDQGKALACELEVFDEPSESMVIATPFAQDSQYFYYNQNQLYDGSGQGMVWGR